MSDSQNDIDSDKLCPMSIPSPIITKRTRTPSTCDEDYKFAAETLTDNLSERALETPELVGKVKTFCREKGHGFITPQNGDEDIFVHISDIEGEFVPLAGDLVKFRICAIPPKFEKYQAVHVQIVDLVPERHARWDTMRV